MTLRSQRFRGLRSGYGPVHGSISETQSNHGGGHHDRAQESPYDRRRQGQHLGNRRRPHAADAAGRRRQHDAAAEASGSVAVEPAAEPAAEPAEEEVTPASRQAGGAAV